MMNEVAPKAGHDGLPALVELTRHDESDRVAWRTHLRAGRRRGLGACMAAMAPPVMVKRRKLRKFMRRSLRPLEAAVCRDLSRPVGRTRAVRNNHLHPK